MTGPTQPPHKPMRSGSSLLSWSFFRYQPLRHMFIHTHSGSCPFSMFWTSSSHSCFWPGVAPGNGGYSPSPAHAQARIQVLTHSPSPFHDFCVPVYTAAHIQQGRWDTPLLPSYLIWLGLHQGLQWNQLVLRAYTSGLALWWRAG